MPAVHTANDRLEAYVREVLSGEVVACSWVRMACERHVRDLADGHERGLWFDERAAAVVVRFFEKVLVHSKGEWAGENIRLEDWEVFVLGSVFGWKRADGLRRFRTAFVEVARKNGKTLLAAGIGLWLMLLDGEGGAEVYSVATTRSQARLSHEEAVRMVRQSALLKRELHLVRDNISHDGSNSRFEPLASDYNSLDGLNIHGAICDELHAWKTRDLFDVIRTATGARRQPLIFEITTAGFDRQSICFQHHDFSEKVLSGAVVDDSWFGIVFAIDEGDDWEDEAVWVKANPNLGVSKKKGDMQMQAAQAREMPAALNAFLRMHLNVWTQAEERWIRPDVWRACAAPEIDEAFLAGRACYAGLDLSTTTDLSALVLVFADGEDFWVLPRFWIPEENMRERERRDRVPFASWVRRGLVTATPGNVIDYAWILDQVERDAELFDLQEVAFDRWGSQQIVAKLQDRGVVMVQFGQGFASMSAPMKELEKLLLGRHLRHGGHEVLTWMADNVVARMDPAGNVKPDKGRSTDRIDGIVALIMGLDRAIRHEDNGSVYRERGLRVL